jgi:predicted RNase H-like nuclease (RuvC/YqgF family)
MEMSHHRDIGELASAAWFEFRAEQSKKRRRVDDTVFISDYTHNPGNTIEHISERRSSLYSELDELKAYQSELENKSDELLVELNAAEHAYLHQRYAQALDLQTVHETERDMINYRHKMCELQQERYDTAYNIAMLTLAANWAERVENYRIEEYSDYDNE